MLTDREKNLIKMHKLAGELTKAYSREKINMIFRMAIEFNDEHEGEEIFVMEDEKAICIEDDYYIFAE